MARAASARLICSSNESGTAWVRMRYNKSSTVSSSRSGPVWPSDANNSGTICSNSLPFSPRAISSASSDRAVTCCRRYSVSPSRGKTPGFSLDFPNFLSDAVPWATRVRKEPADSSFWSPSRFISSRSKGPRVKSNDRDCFVCFNGNRICIGCSESWFAFSAKTPCDLLLEVKNTVSFENGRVRESSNVFTCARLYSRFRSTRRSISGQ